MTDYIGFLHPTNDEYRDFDIIAFRIYCGKVYRSQKRFIRIHRAENVTGDVLKIVSEFAADGMRVLVFESQVLKRDWSRLDDRSIHALKTMHPSECKSLIKHTQLDSWTVESFKIMLERLL